MQCSCFIPVDDQVAMLALQHAGQLDSNDLLEVTPAQFDELAKAAGWPEAQTRLLHRDGELQAVVKVGRRIVRIVPDAQPGREPNA
jgi:hypothetical protein